VTSLATTTTLGAVAIIGPTTVGRVGMAMAGVQDRITAQDTR
jgi:hypothetical protein